MFSYLLRVCYFRCRTQGKQQHRETLKVIVSVKSSLTDEYEFVAKLLAVPNSICRGLHPCLPPHYNIPLMLETVHVIDLF